MMCGFVGTQQSQRLWKTENTQSQSVISHKYVSSLSSKSPNTQNNCVWKKITTKQKVHQREATILFTQGKTHANLAFPWHIQSFSLMNEWGIVCLILLKNIHDSFVYYYTKRAHMFFAVTVPHLFARVWSFYKAFNNLQEGLSTDTLLSALPNFSE